MPRDANATRSNARAAREQPAHVSGPACVDEHAETALHSHLTEAASHLGFEWSGADGCGEVALPSIVLAADVIYDEQLTDALFARLRHALRERA